MDYLNRVRQILTEGYNFTNAIEVLSAIKANQVGVKVQPWVKKELQENTNWEDTLVNALKKYFRRCKQSEIKDTTYGVQLLLSKCDCPGNIDEAVQMDGLYEFLKSYKKPWVKQLPEYKKFIEGKENNSSFSGEEYFFARELHALEKAIHDEQSKHGKSAKGGGVSQEAKTLYDDNTWKLMVPTSFNGEKAIAYYRENGVEKPTHWCTRASENYYSHYTQFGPLYVIRNMKTGKAYQLAFMKNKVEFLDQDDEKGDEVTRGDLAAIPDELLKHIKDPGGDRTLLDYKKSKIDTPTLSKNKILRTEAKSTSDLYSYRNIANLKFGKEIDLGNGVCKKEVLNYTAANNGYLGPDDAISSYFEKNGKGKYVRKNIEVGIVDKDKAALYYLKKNPKIAVIFAVEKIAGRKEATFSYTSSEFHDIGTKEEKKLLADTSMEDFGTAKHEEKKKAARKESWLKTARVDRYFDIGSRNSRYNAFVDKANKNVDFSGSKMFQQLNGFSTPESRTGTIVNELSFVPKWEYQTLNMEKGNWLICVKFTSYDREKLESFNKANKAFGDYESVPFNKAKSAIALLRDHNNKKVVLDDNEFRIAKKAALEVQKQILRIPGYKQLNMERRVQRYKDLVDDVKESNLRRYREEGKSKKQIDRRSDDKARAAINKKWAPRAPVYESVNYFPY